MPDHELSADVLTAIEACRPDSDDAALTEVAAILDREPPARVSALRSSVERVDRAVMAATQRLPVPEGLADRIMANLKAAQAAERVDVVPATLTSRRRRWVAAGACLAMAASLLLAVLWLARGSVDALQLQADARAIYDADDHQAALTTSAVPVVVPNLSIDTVIGWRTAEVLHRQAVVYELAGRRRVRGTLYVLPLRSLWGPKLAGLPATPDPQSTAGTTIGVWADDNHAFVMVVEGSERDFWSLFSRNVAA